MVEDRQALWERAEAIAREVASKYGAAGCVPQVARIDAVPYEDSMGAAAVLFVVWLQDPSEGDYSWAQVQPIEDELYGRAGEELARPAYAEFHLVSEDAPAGESEPAAVGFR